MRDVFTSEENLKMKAVILLSGGLDSAVTLFHAVKKGYDCHCLTFDYGQRHKLEIKRARRIAREAGAKFKLLKIKLPWKGSSLIDNNLQLPVGRKPEDIKRLRVPSTYVPARNTIFLSYAASFAEAIGAGAIFIGAHYEDSSGYPDCRKDYLEAFRKALALGTKAGLEDNLDLFFPLIDKSKKDIIKLGKEMAVPLDLTWSCYSGGTEPCGVCDSCVLRTKGFKEAAYDHS